MAVVKKGNPFNTPTTVPAGQIDTAAWQQKADSYNQQKADKKSKIDRTNQTLGQFGNDLGKIQVGANIPATYQSTAYNSKPKSSNPYDAYQIEETIGGNNYYYPNGQLTTQGQENALNGTGHVAGIPQGPQPVGIDYSQFQSKGKYVPPEQSTTPTQQAPKTAKSGTNGTGVSTPVQDVNQNAVYDKNGNYLGSSDIVNGTGPQNEQQSNNYNDQALIDMENDLMGNTEGTLYGKVTADGTAYGQGINTMADPYNAQTATNESRIKNMKALQTMDSYDIATSIASGTTPYGEQALRDLMQYNPEKYAEVQKYLKQQQGQESIDSIMKDGIIKTTSQTQTATDNVNNDITNRSASVSSNPEQASYVTSSIMNTMANNQVANSATQEMLNINAQLAEYEYKLEHVMDEAKASFRGDTPQYIIEAKANNLTQKYQAEMSKLQSRYNGALDLYKTELANAQREKEMQLKYLQFQETQTNNTWDRYYKSQQLLQNNIKRVDGKAYMVDPTTGAFKQLTDTSAYDTYNAAVGSAMQGYRSMFYDGYECGLQCEQFTDNFTQATTGVRMEAQDGSGRGYTYADEKLSYVNDFTPAVGSVIVAKGGAYDSTYGHTMLITGYDPETGIMDLMWSNTNGDQTIHTSRTTMDNIYRNSEAAGIWNPYLTAQSQSVVPTSGITQYGVTITPMTNIFDEMIAKGKDTDTIAKAEQAYTYLYEMVNDGSLQQLIESGDIGKIMAYMSKGRFGEKDDAGSGFADRLKTYIEKKAAKELTGGDLSLKALNKLVQLVEVKLRKESGAAINSSERLTNFEMFLPQAGETTGYQRDKMASRDSLILRNLRSAGLSSINNYIPVFGTQARQIRAY